MQPAGLATVEEAKKDGRWQKAYASPKNTTLPTDFKKALSANPKAYKYYKSLNRTNTFAFIVRLAFVKKPETRARKITEFVKMLAQGKKLY
jgi:uncharacterized protein YdeI (YjbR/CyaY-like superfamily)